MNDMYGDEIVKGQTCLVMDRLYWYIGEVIALPDPEKGEDWFPSALIYDMSRREIHTEVQRWVKPDYIAVLPYGSWEYISVDKALRYLLLNRKLYPAYTNPAETRGNEEINEHS